MFEILFVYKLLKTTRDQNLILYLQTIDSYNHNI